MPLFSAYFTRMAKALFADSGLLWIDMTHILCIQKLLFAGAVISMESK